MEEMICLKCDTINEQEYYRDGICGECQTASDTAVPCPLGDGGYDCTPFCSSCEGKQFIDKIPDSWTRDTVVLCDPCGQPMLPNVSTLDGEGCAWICLTVGCADYTAEELEFEDLTAVGVPYWVANQIASLVEKLVG
jgi:hypothetical protein